MIKVRFNLGRGVNYMKWKVTYSDKTASYYEPSLFNLNMKNCVLRNNKSTATKIFNGENKTVCAWITCDEIEITPFKNIEVSNKTISFNPRATPNWVSDGVNVDNETFNELYTIDNKIYVGDEIR